MLDASRAVPVTTSLLSEDGKDAFVVAHREEYEKLRKSHAQPKQKLVGIETARKRRTPIEWRAEDIPTPSFTGVRALDNFPLATLRDFIDWSPFFHTWGLKGIYPRIFEHPEYGAQAKQIYTEANALLDKIIAEKLITARGVYGFFPANAVGDDVELYTDNTRTKVHQRFHFLRQQANREGSEPCRSLVDFIAPKETGLQDHIGAFAVTSGICLKELCDGLPRARTTTTTQSWRKPSPTAWPKPSPNACTRKCARNGATAAQEGLSNADLIEEKYRGIRPAAGYPACPDHTEKGPLWNLLDVQKNTGMLITESFAMWPGSSVSGLYFAHPESRYFSLGKIDRDQVEDYAERKGMSVKEVERWLGPNLNYDPAG